MCCLHGLPPQQDLPGLDKSQLEATLYNSSCVQPALISGSLHQNQQLQRCWDTESSSHCPPPSSPVLIMGPIQRNCGRGSTSQPRAADPRPHSQSKSYLSYHQHQREAQLSAERSRPGRRQRKLSISHTAVDSRDVMSEERYRAEGSCGQTAAVQCRDVEPQQVRREQSPVQQQQQRTRPALTLRDHRDGRPESCIPLPRGTDQRSTSLEVSVTAHDNVSDAQSSRLSPSSACTRRKRRSQSIPAELAAPSTSPCAERPTGCAHSLEAGAANKYAGMDPRQRRASDGVLCVVKETSSDMAPTRGHHSPLLSYKTEPDQSFTYVNEEIDYEAKEECRMSRNGHSRDVQKDSERPKVPVVCLERLKILVSQLPPHGRRQSDPLPASTTEKSETLPQQRAWPDALPQGVAGGSETRRAALSLTAPPFAAEQQTRTQSTQSTSSDVDNKGGLSIHKASTPPSTDPKYVPQSYSALELDSDSDPRSVSEDAVVSRADPQVDSDASPDSDPNTESSSEAELECLAEQKSVAAGEMGLCAETDLAGDSEPSLEYEADPESDAGAGSEDGQGLDAESGDAETESDIQPEYDPGFQAETDSNVVSDQPPDSQGSAESELEVESDPEMTADDPQPLRSDLEDEAHVGPGQRPLLIANPVEVQAEHDDAEMESEDFCAVCLIGGELLCCDRCPKVFHLSCHIPSLLSFPSGDWVCSLCRDVEQPEVDYDCENERTSGEHKVVHGLSACDQRKCERLTLLILSNILSAPFHEPVSPLARHYYQIIKRPMDLSVIRARLNKKNTRHYSCPDQFVADVFLMFRNCAKFNYPDSEVAQAGRSLEAFFVSKLREVFPDGVFPAAEVDSDSDEYDEAYRTAESGFPWPERREQCHRKRKRRHSLKSRRYHF
ncbi:tripartite motif-containing protein 66-like isoform X1 [Lates japonicus]